MKKIWVKVLLLLVLLMGLEGGILSVSAKENTVEINGQKMVFLSKNTTYRCDLNKDNKKEILHVVYGKNGKDELYINGQKVLSTKNFKQNFHILDLNKNDKYIEIYALSHLASKGGFYRYKNGKLYKIATGLYGDGNIIPKKIRDNIHRFWYSQPGNGVYIAYAAVGGFRSSQGYGGYVKAQLKFTIKNKKMVFQADAEHNLAIRSSLNGKSNYEISPKASGKLIAYNKPAMHDVQKVFTLPKGERYTYLKVKFSDPYSFIQIKRERTGQTGWVVVRRSQLKIDFNPDF